MNGKFREQLLPLGLKQLLKEGTTNLEEGSTVAQPKLRIRPPWKGCVCS